jgi:hypothetical protein
MLLIESVILGCCDEQKEVKSVGGAYEGASQVSREEQKLTLAQRRIRFFSLLIITPSYEITITNHLLTFNLCSRT